MIKPQKRASKSFSGPYGVSVRGGQSAAEKNQSAAENEKCRALKVGGNKWCSNFGQMNTDRVGSDFLFS